MPRLKWPSREKSIPGRTGSASAAGGPPFDRVFEDYWDPVFRFCYYRLGDWHAAEDAASQTFANALGAYGRFEDRGHPEAVPAWLFKIALNVVTNTRRQITRHPQVTIESFPEGPDREASPEEMVLALEVHRFVHTLIEELKPDQRELVELRLAGLNDVEIAAVLGRSPAAIRKAQSRAVFAMRDQLGLLTHTKRRNDHV